MKVAFVVQRFGHGIAGGAEVLALKVAKMMAPIWNITVLTTTAKEYTSWENHFKDGYDDSFNEFKVLRFPTEKIRNLELFSKTSFQREVSNYSLTKEEEENYFIDQGPYVPSLKKYIADNKDQYDFFIFYTYLYYTTTQTIEPVLHKSYLFPTAHDEPPFYFSRTFGHILKNIKGLLYLSEKERQFVENTYYVPKKTKRVLVKFPISPPLKLSFKERRACKAKFAAIIENPFLLYLGRVTDTKKIPDLHHAFIMMKRNFNVSGSLVFAGPVEIDWQMAGETHQLGYVTEKEKSFLIRHARAIINPSMHESLSIVLFESWLSKTPVLVNGNCEVTRELCVESGGGLYYQSEAMFQRLLQWYLETPRQAKLLGKLGKKFAKERQKLTHLNIIDLH